VTNAAVVNRRRGRKTATTSNDRDHHDSAVALWHKSKSPGVWVTTASNHLLHLCDTSRRLGYHDKEVMTIDDYGEGRAWSLLSNHGHALICLAQQPDMRLWELAQTIGIRERSAQRIVNQLVEAGYLTRQQHDRHRARSSYTVNRDMHLRRAHLGTYTVGDLIDTFCRPPLDVGSHDGSPAAI